MISIFYAFKTTEQEEAHNKVDRIMDFHFRSQPREEKQSWFYSRLSCADRNGSTSHRAAISAVLAVGPFFRAVSISNLAFSALFLSTATDSISWSVTTLRPRSLSSSSWRTASETLSMNSVRAHLSLSSAERLGETLWVLAGRWTTNRDRVETEWTNQIY